MEVAIRESVHVLADGGNRWIPFSIDLFIDFIFINGILSEVSPRTRHARRALLPP
jgi:hypothetical protein